eukprot:7716619-Lingulodinium_polyedra.AAC.1
MERRPAAAGPTPPRRGQQTSRDVALELSAAQIADMGASVSSSVSESAGSQARDASSPAGRERTQQQPTYSD